MTKPSARRTSGHTVSLKREEARRIWLRAQRLDQIAPFGEGPGAVARAVAHLGYVQIDTINVIERCHHHILFNRIPAYRRHDLTTAQSEEKSVFEYWTHALSYVPVEAFPFFVAEMKRHRKEPTGWSAQVEPKELRKVLRRVREQGALTISDIKDDTLVDKDHPWASRKPSKRALQAGFYNGQLTIAVRQGMLKTYELTERHFGWDKLPKPASEMQTNAYVLDRAVNAQGIISLDSVCYLDAGRKPAIKALIEKRVRAKKLVPVEIEGCEKNGYWADPLLLDMPAEPLHLTHILSPFDPLIIQRKRTSAFFGYDHLFEAYVPKAKRKLGYFALPVLMGDRIVAAIDLKTDRQARKLLIQAWHWVGEGNAGDHKLAIEEALDRFETFQLAD